MADERWPLRVAWFWEAAPLARPLPGLCAGIMAYDYGWAGHTGLAPALTFFFGSFLLLAITAAIHQRTRLLDVAHNLAYYAFFLSLGWCAYACTDDSRRQTYFRRAADTTTMHLVRIDAAPQVRAATTKFPVRLLYAVDSNGRKGPVTGKALLYIYHRPGALELQEGDTLLVAAKWQPVRNSGNPFELDVERLQRRRGVQYQQFVTPDDIVLFSRGTPDEVGNIQHIHNWCDRQLKAYIRDSAALGLLQAMLLGDERGFEPELRQAYAQTGIIHIVSISGSHVAVLFLVVTWALFWTRGRAGSIIRYAVGISLVWFYVLLAGAPPSALRSALMFTIIALGILSERDDHPLNTLLGAAFGLLVAEPAWLFSVGFQLSFLAVLSMLLFYRPLYRIWPQTNKVGRIIVQAVAASIAAEILTAPLVIYYFHNFPVTFILANLLAAVLVGFCALVGGMVVIAFSWWPVFARAVGDAVAFLVTWFNRIILRLQEWNPDSFGYLQISLAELLCIYLLIAACGVWWLKREKRGLLVALPVACMLLLMLSMDKWKALRQERIMVYNNGRRPLAERFRGQYASTLFGTVTDFVGKPGRIGWHAWKESKTPSSAYFTIAGKRALTLTDSTKNTFAFPLPVDVLIIARPLRGLRIGEVMNAFSPKEIVLAQKPSPYTLLRWKDSCAARDIRLFNVAEEGAWLLQ